jgi:lipocalin
MTKNAPGVTAANAAPEKFAGKWYVVATNYAFWKNESRTNPIINLDLLNDGSGRTFLSRVTYNWKGFGRTITGYETQDKSTAGRYVWQGKGLLSVIKNEWYLIAVADDYSWAFTFFPKSNVGTPEGIDILSRTPDMSEELMQKIISQVREDEFMKTKTEGIFRCVQGG